MSNIEKSADIINEVYLGAEPVSPLRMGFDEPDVDTAYAIQEVNTKRWLREGRKLTGRKIGLTSVAVQKQLGVDQPDYGMLFDDMEASNGEELPFGAVCQARIEGEVAFVLGRDLVDDVLTMNTLIEAIEYAAPAFEIVGSRVRDWDITIFDTIADNASSGKYVLGDARVPLTDIDLLACEMTLLENGKIVSTGNGAACLGNPLNAALWLAQKMVETGRPLERGDVIMSGALGPFVDVTPGGAYELNISGLGSVSTRFSQD
mgnify:CR=1 FL=1